jgi:hypothetical protein
MVHKVGDLVFDSGELELGVIIKIWTAEEIREAGLDYDDYIYEIYFPESGERDRWNSVDDLKRNLVKRLAQYR